MKRLLVTGSRTWTDTSLIRKALREATLSLGVPTREITLVHGDARGADRLTAECARRMGMQIEAHPADWRTHGKSAGFRRNTEMVRLGADLGLAFASSWASGTGHCARLARRAGTCVVDYGADTTADARPAAHRVPGG